MFNCLLVAHTPTVLMDGASPSLHIVANPALTGSGLRTAAAPAPLTTQWHCSFTLTHQSTNTHRLKSVLSDLPCLGKGLPGLRMQEHLILQCGFLN